MCVCVCVSVCVCVFVCLFVCLCVYLFATMLKCNIYQYCILMLTLFCCCKLTSNRYGRHDTLLDETEKVST